jgi:hypothetical protein
LFFTIVDEMNRPMNVTDQVLSIYAELTHRTVLRSTTQLPKVNVMLSNQTPWSTEEAIQALDTVLAMNGISMVNVSDKFVSAVPSNAVLQEGGAFSKEKPEEMAETGQFVTKVVKVKHALPSELQQVIASFSKTQNGILPIDSTMTLVLRDYPANVKRMTEVIEQVDVEVEKEYKLEVIPIKYGKVDELYGTMSSLIGGSAGGAAAGAGAVARTTGGAGPARATCAPAPAAAMGAPGVTAATAVMAAPAPTVEAPAATVRAAIIHNRPRSLPSPGPPPSHGPPPQPARSTSVSRTSSDAPPASRASRLRCSRTPGSFPTSAPTPSSCTPTRRTCR